MSDESDEDKPINSDETGKYFTGSEWMLIILCIFIPPIGIAYYFLNYEQVPEDESNHTGKVTFALGWAAFYLFIIVISVSIAPTSEPSQPTSEDPSQEDEMTREEAVWNLDARSEELDLSGIREDKQSMTEVQFEEADEERAGKLVKMRGYVDEVGESAIGTPKLTLTERPRGESLENALRAKAVFTLDGDSGDYTHLDKYEEVVAYGTYDEYYSLAGFDSVQIDDAVVLEASAYDKLGNSQENSSSK